MSDIQYRNMRECVIAEQIPKETLRLAKLRGAPGFRANGRIFWNELKPWLDTHKNDPPDNVHSLEHYKIEIAKRDVILKEQTIKKNNRELIDPTEIQNFLTGFGTILSSVLNKKRQELLSKCTGYETIIDKEFLEIFKLVKEEIGVWSRK